MPRITQDQSMETHAIAGTNFTFQGARLENLGATEYTLVTIAVDVTGSTSDFADDLRAALVSAVDACKKSPRSDNLLLRVLTFSSTVGINELHGFKQLEEIDAAAYPVFRPSGLTPLYDAVYSGIGAMIEYGERLKDDDFLANAIVFVITDGDENDSKNTTAGMIRSMVAEANREEKIESLVSVLIGVNAVQFKDELESFRQETGIDRYIDAGEASKGRLAKLAEFVSRSISSQSQALGTGGPSQNIAATI
ncbi:MAG: hypothetical protein WCJ25_03720 [Candidatus Moraniibacteriota bacterium]